MEKNNSVWIILGVVALAVVGLVMLTSNSAEETTTPETVTSQPVAVTEDTMMEEEMMEADKTIVEIAVESGDFDTLVTAVTEAGLVETLSGEGPFTVFAPNDEAFAKVPEATLTALLADKEQLTSVLTYHVVAGKVMAEDVVGLTSATTVNGQDLTIEVTEDGTVMVDGAKVLVTDIEASNGVIHVIDSVVLPQ